jgi:hypothetical protein
MIYMCIWIIVAYFVKSSTYECIYIDNSMCPKECSPIKLEVNEFMSCVYDVNYVNYKIFMNIAFVLLCIVPFSREIFTFCMIIMHYCI